jgi:hypothetical protein
MSKIYKFKIPREFLLITHILKLSITYKIYLINYYLKSSNNKQEYNHT